MHDVYTRPSKNLPFSTDDVKRVCSSCRTCAEIKPQFHAHEAGTLIKTNESFERLNIDFEEPLPSRSRNMFMQVIIDEFSRFPLCFECLNTLLSTLIKCVRKIVFVMRLSQRHPHIFGSLVYLSRAQRMSSKSRHY